MKVALTLTFALALLVPLVALAADDPGTSQVLTEATEVYQELIKASDNKVPLKLQQDCDCIAVFPKVYKAAIGFGGRYGKGVVTCRDSVGWSPVAFFKLTGGSWGLQLGGEKTELVLFFMTERSAKMRPIPETGLSLSGLNSKAWGVI